MATRRETIRFGLATLLPHHDGDVGADRIFAALDADYHRIDENIAAELRSCAAQERGSDVGRLEMLHERVEALDRNKGRIANAILNRPSATFLEVARKLILWRSEAATVFPCDFYHAHEWFAFSAYQDVLRLAGVRTRTHPNDALTAEKMRGYG